MSIEQDLEWNRREREASTTHLSTLHTLWRPRHSWLGTNTQSGRLSRSSIPPLGMLGGYAVSSVDTLRGIQEYTPLSSYSLWGEVVYGKELELALLGGYTENPGADDVVRGAFYARGSNIHHVLRVAPRVA